MSPSPQFLAIGPDDRLAYHLTPGRAPGVIFCGGFNSDMTGTKATALQASCEKHGRAYLRFDYQGHGASSGAFVDGTISRWTEDALAVLDQLTQGPQIIVGSSMGGWIMMRMALARPERIAGLVGIAPAPDFAARLWKSLPDEAKDLLRSGQIYQRPSRYDDGPYPIAMQLIEDGYRCGILDKAPLPVDCPVRILHGMKDPDVPWQQSLTLAEAIAGDDIEIRFFKNGDHRLSDPPILEQLTDLVENLARISKSREG